MITIERHEAYIHPGLQRYAYNVNVTLLFPLCKKATLSELLSGVLLHLLLSIIRLFFLLIKICCQINCGQNQ